MSHRRKRRLATAIVVAVILSGAVVSAAVTSPATPTSHACGGHQRWQIKVLIDDSADLVNTTTAVHRSIRRLGAIERPEGFVGALPRQTPVEATKYQLRRVYLVEAKTEKDDDIHLVVADKAGRTMIVEFPDPGCPDTGTSDHIDAMTGARDAFIAACGKPSRSDFVNLEGRATIDGVGFFDVIHGGKGQRGRAANNIELHPVLRYRSFGCRRL